MGTVKESKEGALTQSGPPGDKRFSQTMRPQKHSPGRLVERRGDLLAACPRCLSWLVERSRLPARGNSVLVGSPRRPARTRAASLSPVVCICAPSALTCPVTRIRWTAPAPPSPNASPSFLLAFLSFPLLFLLGAVPRAVPASCPLRTTPVQTAARAARRSAVVARPRRDAVGGTWLGPAVL